VSFEAGVHAADTLELMAAKEVVQSCGARFTRESAVYLRLELEARIRSERAALTRSLLVGQEA
jgi:hypothetical protein